MQEWQYPYEVHQVTVADSIEIAYVDEGSGDRTLLFLHGLGSNLQAWQKNIDMLDEEYRCIALDFPGYGKSSKAAYPFGMQFFAETVQAFMDSLDLQQVVLVGHSMGGQVAMHTVLANTDRIDQLILIAPAGFETFTEQERQWFKAIYTADLIRSTTEEQIVRNFQLNFHDMPTDAQFMIDDRMLMRESSEYDYYCEMIPQCVLGMLQEPVYERLPEISVPTLVIYGKNDALIPNKLMHPDLSIEALVNEAGSRIPNARLYLVAEAGHFVQWEQADDLYRIVISFLQQD